MPIKRVMISKRSLPIVLLTLALAIGTVAMVHAPTSVTTIRPPVISPTAPTSSDIVTVATNVTSSRSTIKNVTITYTTDNWKSNITVVATYNSTSDTAKALIPALPPSTHVQYYITAFDNVPTKTVNDNNGNYFIYNVSASTSLTSISTLTYILVAAGIAAAIAAVAFMILKAPQGKQKQSKPSLTQDQSWTRGSP